MDLLSDAEERKDLASYASSAEAVAVEVLAECINELRNDIRKDGRAVSRGDGIYV